MTVLMLIDNYYPLVGGAERQADALGRKLLEKGVKVRVVTEKKERGWKTEELINGIEVKRLPFPNVKILGGIVLFIRLVLYLLKNRKEYDVIHVHIVKYFAFIGALAGKLLGKKIILKFSGWEELDRGVLNEQQRKKPLYRLLTWGVMKADYFIAISSEIGSALKRCDFPSHKVVLLPNGVDTELFCPEKDKAVIRKKMLGEKAGLTGAFVGRLVNEKGLSYLLEAWKRSNEQYPDARLYILGGGYLIDELKEKVIALDLNDTVIFKGEVNYVPEYLKAVDFYVSPSTSEGLSNTLLEAMASGLPAIGTKISGNEDLIFENENGFLIPPKDSLCLAEAIKSLLGDEDLRMKMGKESRRIIERTYSLDMVANQYLELYNA